MNLTSRILFNIDFNSGNLERGPTLGSSVTEIVHPCASAICLTIPRPNQFHPTKLSTQPRIFSHGHLLTLRLQYPQCRIHHPYSQHERLPLPHRGRWRSETDFPRAGTVDYSLPQSSLIRSFSRIANSFSPLFSTIIQAALHSVVQIHGRRRTNHLVLPEDNHSISSIIRSIRSSALAAAA